MEKSEEKGCSPEREHISVLPSSPLIESETAQAEEMDKKSDQTSGQETVDNKSSEPAPCKEETSPPKTKEKQPVIITKESRAVVPGNRPPNPYSALNLMLWVTIELQVASKKIFLKKPLHIKSPPALIEKLLDEVARRILKKIPRDYYPDFVRSNLTPVIREIGRIYVEKFFERTERSKVQLARFYEESILDYRKHMLTFAAYTLNAPKQYGIFDYHVHIKGKVLKNFRNRARQMIDFACVAGPYHKCYFQMDIRLDKEFEVYTKITLPPPLFGFLIRK